MNKNRLWEKIWILNTSRKYFTFSKKIYLQFMKLFLFKFEFDLLILLLIEVSVNFYIFGLMLKRMGKRVISHAFYF